MQDFIADAYLVAYDALVTCGDKSFEAYFWVKFKNRCKTLANKPHESRFTRNIECIYGAEHSLIYDEAVIECYLSILTPKQKEVFTASPSISGQARGQRINSAIRTILALRQSTKA